MRKAAVTGRRYVCMSSVLKPYAVSVSISCAWSPLITLVNGVTGTNELVAVLVCENHISRADQHP